MLEGFALSPPSLIHGRERPHPTRINSSSPRYEPPPSSRLCLCPALHPPADLLEHPLGGIQLSRLDDGCQSNTPYHLTTRSIPHQRLHVRVMLQADCRRYSLSHRVDPTHNSERLQNRCPLVDHALADAPSLHGHPADPPQPHSHLIGKGSELTPAPARAQLKPLHLRLPSHRAASQPLKQTVDAARLPLHTRTLSSP